MGHMYAIVMGRLSKILELENFFGVPRPSQEEKAKSSPRELDSDGRVVNEYSALIERRKKLIAQKVMEWQSEGKEIPPDIQVDLKNLDIC